MFKNPVTSIIGVAVVLCPILSSVFPELKPLCEKITEELIGFGLIAAADGVQIPKRTLPS